MAWYDDPVVAGEDFTDVRPGFVGALGQIAGNGVRTIIVETANRFARDLIVQRTGFRRLQADGITLIAADKPDSFVDARRLPCWCVRSWVPLQRSTRL